MSDSAEVYKQVADNIRAMADSVAECGEADGVEFGVFLYDEFDETEVKGCDMFTGLMSAIQYHSMVRAGGGQSQLVCFLEDFQILIAVKKSGESNDH